MGNIYLIGDIHANIEITKLSVKNWIEQKELCIDDILIILGDFGLVWDEPESREELYWIKWLLDKKCTIAFIDGNHENFNRLNSYPISRRWDGNVQIIKYHKGKCLYRLMRGEIYNICNSTILTIGGADSTDKEYRTVNKNWWKGEKITESDYEYAMDNLQIYDYKVDYVLSHTAPTYLISMLGSIRYGMDDDSSNILARLDYELDCITWHFGHFHLDTNIYEKYYCHYNDIYQLTYN